MTRAESSRARRSTSETPATERAACPGRASAAPSATTATSTTTRKTRTSTRRSYVGRPDATRG